MERELRSTEEGRGLLSLPHDIDVDGGLYWVDALKGGVGNVRDYFRLDIRVAWRPTKKLELSFIAQDLLDNAHPEFATEQFSGQAMEIERAFFGMLRVDF
jgi:iron complex outermembrane receptor protein